MTISDEELKRLQREASERAARNWDEDEHADFDQAFHQQPLPLALADALEHALDDFIGRRVTPHIPGDYTDYLRTPHWRAVRRRMLERSGGFCQRCQRRFRLAALDVHHRDYRHIGAERERDLEVLCRECHQLEHS
jgi:hypothetical protein